MGRCSCQECGVGLKTRLAIECFDCGLTFCWTCMDNHACQVTCKHDWEVKEMTPHENPFHIGDTQFQRCRKCGEEGTF